MRVALLALHFSEYACRLALALAKHHQVLLVLNGDNARKELTPELRRKTTAAVEELVEVPWCPFRNPRWVVHAAKIRAVLRRFKPDVIHSQENFSDAHFWSVMTRPDGPPVVLTVHDHVPHSGSDARGRSAKHEVYCRAMRKISSAVIVHSDLIAREYADTHPSHRGRIHSIAHGPLGVDDHVTISRAPAEDPRRLLFFGRVEAYKGLGVLLDACDLLTRQGVAYRLVVAGRGADLEQHRSRLADPSRFELVDRFIEPEEIEQFFSSAWTTVLPYTDATQSGVAAIAFAYHCPVVATRVGGLPEVVRDGESGIVVPPRDPAALAAALARLLGDAGLRNRLADGAAHMVETVLSWDSIAAATSEVYRSVLPPAAAVYAATPR